MATAPMTSLRRREGIYLALTLLPISLLTLTLLTGLAREAVSSVKIKSIVAQLKIDEEPTDYATLWTAQTNSSPSAVQAREIKLSNASEHLNSRYGETLRTFSNSEKLMPPRQPLEYEKILEKYNEDAKPIISSIGESAYSHQTLTVLDREFRTAFHQGDRQHALKNLQRLGPDSDLVLKSLEYGFWTAEELSQLRAMYDTRSDLRLSWRNNISMARARLLIFPDQVDRWNRYMQWHDNPFGLFGIAPSHKLARLELLNSAADLPELGTKFSKNSANALEKKSVAFSLVSVPFALANPYEYYGNYWSVVSRQAADFWQSSMTTRRVITAIAIKQFKLQEGRWPESLDELTKVGLTSFDWKIVDNQDFGYRVVEDGKAVLLWTGGVEKIESPKWFEKEFRTPSQPPSEAYLNASAVANLQSTIR